MSNGFHFVSRNGLDKKFFDELHLLQYSADEITVYVRDAKEGVYYYLIDPVTMCTMSPHQRGNNIDDREMGPAEFLRFFANKLYQQEGFSFMYVRLYDDDIAEYHFEEFLRKCNKESITIEDFNIRSLDPEELFKLDTAYYIKPK